MIVKTVKVTNPSNVLVQIPKFIVEKWGLTDKDGIEVHVDNDGETVTIKPRKRYVRLSIGGDSNQEG